MSGSLVPFSSSDASPSRVKKPEVMAAVRRFSSLPEAVSSAGPGSSHFQAQCHCSHSRAVFDMSVTLAGVFEETESGEGGGQEREVNATPSHSALQFTCPSFKWVCAEKTTSLGSATGSASNVDTSKTSKAGDTVLYQESNPKCGI